jgi:UDP-glucose 4-epimerase
MKQRLVLLGGSGFIGQSLLRFQAKSRAGKKLETVIFDPRPPQFFQPDHFVQGKIEESEKIKSLLDSGDIVFHLVHTTIPSDATDSAGGEEKENVEPSHNLIELLKKLPVLGLVYLSSGGTVYGETKNRKPVPETAPVNPRSPYARAKVKIEKAVQNSGVPYLIIRPGNPFGPFQEILNRHGAVGRIFHALAKNQPFTIYGRGETIRDYVYIDDFISAFLLLVNRDHWGQVFNIGAGTGASLEQVIALCEKVSGRNLRKKFEPLRKTDLKYNVLDVSKLESLGWSPKFSLEQGLQKTWEYFLKKK